MAGQATPRPPAEDGPHLLLYDGVCGLCTGIVQFVLARDRVGRFHFASLQSPAAASRLTAFNIDPSDLSTFVAIVNYQDRHATAVTKATAALFVAKTLGWPWKAATLFGILPRGLLNAVYDSIARNRYRIVRQRETCALPKPEHRARFIDAV